MDQPTPRRMQDQNKDVLPITIPLGLSYRQPTEQTYADCADASILSVAKLDAVEAASMRTCVQLLFTKLSVALP
jgi:hypothetical protein